MEAGADTGSIPGSAGSRLTLCLLGLDRCVLVACVVCRSMCDRRLVCGHGGGRTDEPLVEQPRRVILEAVQDVCICLSLQPIALLLRPADANVADAMLSKRPSQIQARWCAIDYVLHVVRDHEIDDQRNGKDVPTDGLRVSRHDRLWLVVVVGVLVLRLISVGMSVIVRIVILIM